MTVVMAEEMHPVSNFAAYWNSSFLGVAMTDWLVHLQEKNEKAIALAQHLPPEVQPIYPGPVPQIVDCWCRMMCQPYGVHHRTLDLYEQFNAAHCIDLFRELHSQSAGRARWQAVCAQVRDQALLRLVSCFQIASKLQLNYKMVSLNQACRLLRRAHRPCDRGHVLRSEIQVLTTLMYQVNLPPTIDYVETVLCHMLFFNKKTSREDCLFVQVVDHLHDVSKLLIDLVYQNRRDFFRRILTFVSRTCNFKPEDRAYVRRLQHDRLLLATAIISAAAFIVEPHLQAYIAEKIDEAVSVRIKDVSVVASVVVNLLEPTV